MPIIASHTFRKAGGGGKTFKAMRLDHKRGSDPMATRFILSAEDGRTAFTIADDDDQLAFLHKHAIERVATGEEPDAAWPYPFQIGDLVQLKSGGHRMVVTGLSCSEGTCGDPYKGKLQQVSVAWSTQSQMEGDDISEEDLDPAVLMIFQPMPHERFPF